MNGHSVNETIEDLESLLGELGISVTAVTAAGPQHATVRLARGRSKHDYSLLYGPAITSTDVARADGAERSLLVFTTYAAPKTADTFRRAGVQYVDAAGNAWLSFGDVLVDIRGHGRPDRPTTHTRLKGNLFSSARAQVVAVLLAWPYLWGASQRVLAHAAGVSLGQAHQALALLADAGYDKNTVRSRQAALLDLWAAAFPTGLAHRLTLASFQGDVDEPKVTDRGGRAFISGEPAVRDLLRPASLTLYVEELDPRLPVVNRWRTDGIPNIVVRRVFWRDPDEQALSRLAVAPWPLVYADLLSSDDPRVRGAAEQWRERRARAV
jgi:hypothetical protein